MTKSEAETLFELALTLQKPNQLNNPDYLSFFCDQCVRILSLDACTIFRINHECNNTPRILCTHPETASISDLDFDILINKLFLSDEIGVINQITHKKYIFNAGSLGHVMVSGDLSFSQKFNENFADLIKDISAFYISIQETTQLKKHNQRLILATKAGGIGTWELDIVTQELTWDDQMFQLYEVDRCLFDGSDNFFKSQLHPEDRDTLQALINNYLSLTSNGPIDYQFRIVTPSGKIKKLAGHADIKTYKNSHQHLIGVNYDITEIETARTQSIYRSQLENLLIDLSIKVIRSGPDELDNVTNQALEVVGSFVGADRAYRFSYDFDANVSHNTHEWCNEGITPEIDNLQGISNNDIDFWISSHKRGLPMYVARVLDLPEGHGLREILEPQGVKSLITIPLMEADNCLGFIGFDSVTQQRHWSNIDVSILKLLANLLTNAHIKAEHERTIQETQRALVDSRDTARYLAKEAATANVAKSRFVASVSHEIRTPLHAILGIADLVLLKISDPSLAENLNTIKKAGTILLALVNDVLEFSTAEANEVSIECKPFAIKHLADNLVKMFLPLAKQMNLALDIDIQPCFPEILIGDEFRIQQILSNFISNSIKFTKVGSVTVHIALNNNHPKQDTNLNSAHIMFEVVDTGVGIARDDMDKLFDPFFQSVEARTNHLGGTGLGLSISHLLASKMGGLIKVKSLRNLGSTFTLEIALQSVGKQPKVKDASIKEVHKDLQLGGIRLLLAEDNPVNQQLVQAFLHNTGCQLKVVANGEQVLDAYQNGVYDMILMDCLMPKLDGFDTTKIIRLQESNQRRIPILAITASALEADKMSCLASGMDDVLTKPFNKQELLNAIMSQLGFFSD